jgi:hypothetical protein
MFPKSRRIALIGLGFVVGAVAVMVLAVPPWARRASAQFGGLGGRARLEDGRRFEISSWAATAKGAPRHGAYVIDAQTGQVFSIEGNGKPELLGSIAPGRPPIAEQREATTGGPGGLVGTWKLVSARYGGEDFQFPAGLSVVKHVTTAQFVTVIYNAEGKIQRAAGGTYERAGNVYKETPEYGTSENFDEIRGKVQTFDCKLDGNTWRHQGRLSNGLMIEEQFERVTGSK